MAKEVRIACPKCDWEPDGGAYWSCTCGHNWNTFETGGRCPRCGKQWKYTQCIPHRGGCSEWSLHEDWYRGLDEWLEEEMESEVELGAGCLQFKMSNKNTPKGWPCQKMSNSPEAMVGYGQIAVYPGAPGISSCQREPPQFLILSFYWTFSIVTSMLVNTNRYRILVTGPLVPPALSNGAVSGGYFPARQGARREHSRSYVTDEQRSMAGKESAKLRWYLVPEALAPSPQHIPIPSKIIW